MLPQDVIEFLQEQYPKIEVLQDDDLTAERAAEIWGCDRSTAGDRLRKMVAEGKLERITKKIDPSSKTQVLTYKKIPSE